MKKSILILGLILAFNTNAEIVTGDKCGDDCTWTFNTETGKLTISGTGDMYDWTMTYVSSTKLWDKDVTHYQTTAPWKEYATSIQSVDIKDGITSVGKAAFYNTTVSEVNMPNSLTSIKFHAFQYAANLEEIDLPQNLETIGHGAFAATSVKSFVVPESVTAFQASASGVTNSLRSDALESLIFEGDVISKDIFSSATRPIPSSLTSIYCKNSNIECQNLLTDSDIGSKISFFDKQDGVYISSDGNMYTSASDMVNTIDACAQKETIQKTLDACKATVLQNKGYCTGEACAAMVETANDGRLLKVGSKTYSSINDLLKGNYDRRRIYTVEEANFVAGERNTVTIRYK